MAGYQLPQFQYPTNATLDFSPITQGLNVLGKTWEHNRKTDNFKNALAQAQGVVDPRLMALAEAQGYEQGPNALMQAYAQQEQRALMQRHHDAQIAQSKASLAHQQATLAEQRRFHDMTNAENQRRTNLMDERVRLRYGPGEDGAPLEQAPITDSYGLNEEGQAVPLRRAPSIGPRDGAGPPPIRPQGAVPPSGPAIGYGLFQGSQSGNIEDMRGRGPIRTGEALVNDHPDRERLRKMMETQRIWTAIRGARAPQGYEYREDGTLQNLKEGSSIKEMKLDKEIPVWLQHLEVSRKVLENAGRVERGVGEGLNSIPGVRQFNPFTSVIEARDLSAHAVQQLVNYTRAANHANKVDERHLEWFVPKASDPPDLVQFKLSQASNIFTSYLSARAKGAPSEELSNLIKKSLDASENTSVFQRYKRITGDSGNAPMEKDLSRNVEYGPGVSAPQQQAAPRASSAENPALQQAREAIARGANRDQVIRRLRENGINPAGL